MKGGVCLRVIVFFFNRKMERESGWRRGSRWVNKGDASLDLASRLGRDRIRNIY
jgi:hypothetical protein